MAREPHISIDDIGKRVTRGSLASDITDGNIRYGWMMARWKPDMKVRLREDRALVEALRDQVTYCKEHLDSGRAENWSFVRRFISKGGSLYARTLLSLPIKDCTGGFKCLRRRVLEALGPDSVRSDGYGFQVEMNYLCQRAGFKIIEVPIVIPDRTAGQSKMSAPIFLEAVALVLRLRGQEPSFSPEFDSDPEPSSTSHQDQRDGVTS